MALFWTLWLSYIYNIYFLYKMQDQMLELWPVTASTIKLSAYFLVLIWPTPAAVSWIIPWCGLGDAAVREFFSMVVWLLREERTRGQAIWAQVVLSHLPSGLRNWASRGLFTNMFGIYFSFDPCWVLKLGSDPSADCVGGGQLGRWWEWTSYPALCW